MTPIRTVPSGSTCQPGLCDLPADAVRVGEVTVVPAEGCTLRGLDDSRPALGRTLEGVVHLDRTGHVVRESESDARTHRSRVNADVLGELVRRKQPEQQAVVELEEDDLTGDLQRGGPT